jgi:dTDP-4-amino-4,6-dideoxygalactose transaminase
MDIIHCSTLSFKWSRLPADCVAKPTLPCWPQLEGDCIIPFYQGRVALWHLCHLWQFKDGDEVLMPAYNCGTEVEPFLAYGAKVVFYRVDEHARIDDEDLKKRYTAKTRIVYITHYFGWPHPVKDIYKWCKERNIYVVEDCALSLFSYSDEGYLGTLADASIFSFRKFLPVPDGAALVLRKPVEPNTLSLRPPAAMQTVRNLLPFAKSTALSALDAVRLYGPLRRMKLKSFDLHTFVEKNVQAEKPDMPADYYFDERIQSWSISNISAGILRRTDPEKVLDQRRKNYLSLLERIREIPGVKPLFNDLPEGVCPLGLMVLVTPRSAVAKALNQFGIAACPWWEGYHRKCDWKDFPEARFLKDHVLYLPINQSMQTPHMRYILSCLRNIYGSFELH